MNLKAFLALALATLIAVVGVFVVLTTQNTGPTAREPGSLMLPELATNTANVTRVISTRGGDKTTIKRHSGSGEDAKWVVEEFFDYPSHPLLLRDVIGGVAHLQSHEAKTRRPNLYSKLDVDDPTSATAKSTRLEMFGPGDKKLADIIIGKTKSAMPGQESLYVRRPDEDRAWLAKGKAEAPYNRIGWVDNQVLVIDLPRIRTATLNTPAKGPRVHVFKKSTDERDFTIEGMPADFEVKDIFGAEDVARVIQQLSFEDVRPADKLAIDTTAKPWAEFVAFDGLKIDLWLREAEGKNWVAVRALAAPGHDLAAALATTPAATPAAQDGATDKQDSGEKPRDLAAEIKTINEKVTPWIYAIPTYENGNLRKTLDDLIQKKAEAKTN